MFSVSSELGSIHGEFDQTRHAGSPQTPRGHQLFLLHVLRRQYRELIFEIQLPSIRIGIGGHCCGLARLGCGLRLGVAAP